MPYDPAHAVRGGENQAAEKRRSGKSGIKANRDASRRRKVIAVDRALLQCRGERPRTPPFRDLLDGLVHTILSQNTSDVNSQRAFQSLKRSFPTWEEAAVAGADEIEKAIRQGGISRIKAERIENLLELLEGEFGSYSLEAIRDMEPHEALRYLLELPGVGRKTAAVLLLFQLGYPFFPVDTHVSRVGKRLGILPAESTFQGAHDIMDASVPDDIKYRLHINLVEHGRQVCKARNPQCGACCLKGMCPRNGLEED
jgi:endonuclease-3